MGFVPQPILRAAPAYLDAFFRNIHWETIASRLENGLKLLALARQTA
jgi:Fe-Mn family superoxide dismutase